MLGRTTSGEYELLIGLDTTRPTGPEHANHPGAPIAEPAPFAAGIPVSVRETATLVRQSPTSEPSAGPNMSPGDTLTAYVEVTSGNLKPRLTLRNYGGKPLDATNADGSQTHAELQYKVPTEAEHYSLEVRAASLPDGTPTEGDYRILVGLNAADVLAGQAQPQGGNVLLAPVEVKTGLKVLRISEVDSPNEKYTVLASLMDWMDRDLAFSPDTCNCSSLAALHGQGYRQARLRGKEPVAGFHILQSTGESLDPEPDGCGLARSKHTLLQSELQHDLPG